MNQKSVESLVLSTIAVLGFVLWLFDEAIFLGGMFFPDRVALGLYQADCQAIGGRPEEKLEYIIERFATGSLCEWQPVSVFDIGAIGAVFGLGALLLLYRLRKGCW